MEVTVLQADNVPERPVLDIRMGPSRQQTPLEVNKLMSLPHPGNYHLPVEVGLFERLVSQVLPVQEHGAREVQIPVLPHPQLGSPATQVRLRIRSTPMSDRFADAEAALSSSSSGPRRSPLGSSAPASLTISWGSNGSVRDDQDMDRMMDWFQGMMGDVLREQPADPLVFMLTKLRKKKEDTAAQLSDLRSACTASPGSTTTNGYSTQDKAPQLLDIRSACAASSTTLTIAASSSLGSTAVPSTSSSCVSEVAQTGELSPQPGTPIPRLPDTPPPLGRSGRTLGRQAAGAAAVSGSEAAGAAAAAARSKAAEDPPIPVRQRSNSKVAAHFCISLILQGSACQVAMQESWREKARKDVAAGMAKSAIARVSAVLLSEASSGSLSRCPSRQGRKSTLGRPSLLITEAAASAARSAGERDLPTPIVSLGGHRHSWGQWLA